MNPARILCVLLLSICVSTNCMSRSNVETCTTSQPSADRETPKSSWLDQGRLSMHLEKPRMQRRRKRIQAELERLGEHEWAGVYCYGDGMGCNVSVALSPEAGVAYSSYGCLGLNDLNHGDIIDVKENRIRLRLAIDPSTSRFNTLDNELWRVRWGKRHYLIPRERILDFCNKVNSGAEPNQTPDTSGRFLLRERDTHLAVTGLPAVPP